MLDAVVAAAFENVEEADEVGIGIAVRIVEGVAHAGLGGEMHDALRAFLGEQIGDGGAVGEVGFDEAEIGESRQAVEPGVLKRDFVVVVDVVEADDGIAPLEEHARGVEADEARCSRNQYLHVQKLPTLGLHRFSEHGAASQVLLVRARERGHR